MIVDETSSVSKVAALMAVRRFAKRTRIATLGSSATHYCIPVALKWVKPAPTTRTVASMSVAKPSIGTPVDVLAFHALMMFSVGLVEVSATRTQTAVFPTIVPVVTRTGIVSATNCATGTLAAASPKRKEHASQTLTARRAPVATERAASVFLKTSAGLPLIVLLESCVTGSSVDQLVLEIAVGTTMAAAMVLSVSVESVEMKTMPGGDRVEVVLGVVPEVEVKRSVAPIVTVTEARFATTASAAERETSLAVETMEIVTVMKSALRDDASPMMVVNPRSPNPSPSRMLAVRTRVARKVKPVTRSAVGTVVRRMRTARRVDVAWRLVCSSVFASSSPLTPDRFDWLSGAKRTS